MNRKGSLGRQTRKAGTPESSLRHFGTPVEFTARLLLPPMLEVQAKGILHEKRRI
jgi:hypothetical protein